MQELGETISPEELEYWQYYLQSEPSEIEKLRYQMAQHSVLYANVNYQKDNNFGLSDMFLDFSEQQEEAEAKEENIDEIEEFRKKNREFKQKLKEQLKGMIE